MRLTLVISSLGLGGAERVLSVMAGHWAAKGWHITLITFDAAENDFFSLPPAVTRVALDLMGDSPNPISAMRSNIGRVRRLRQAILTSRPQAVISFLDKINVLTLLACLKSPFPVIVSERVDPSRHSIGRVWSILRRRLYPHAAAVVIQSEAVRGWAERFLQSRAVFTIPNPVLPPTSARLSASQTPAAPPSRPVIAALGRLVPQKGFDLLIRATAQVLEKHPAWSLMILGEGPERKNLEQLAGDLGFSHRIRFPGHVQDPTRLLRQADLFVLSSRFEGFPNALLEAMSCGLPVISADCPSGPREIVRDGVDGLLIPTEDVGALAAALNRLMSDAAERARLAGHASEVLNRFGIERIMGLWEDLLDRLLKPDRLLKADILAGQGRLPVQPSKAQNPSSHSGASHQVVEKK